jgi:hypothetical protein
MNKMVEKHGNKEKDNYRQYTLMVSAKKAEAKINDGFGFIWISTHSLVRDGS